MNVGNSEENGKKGLDEIKKEKIEERLERLEQQNREIKKENKQLKNEVENLKANSNQINSSRPENDSEGISRRSFLKKAGLGSVGLAAVGLSPASALNLRSNSLSFSDNNNEYLNISNGSIGIKQADLMLNGNGINGVGELELPESEPDNEDKIWIEKAQQELRIKIDGQLYASKLGTVVSDKVIDNFDKSLYEDKDNLLADYYSGDLSNFSRVESAYSGSSLEGSSGGGNAVITSTSGLNYPSKGDKISLRYYADSGEPQHRFGFGTVDSTNGYTVEINHDSPDFKLAISVDGSRKDSSGSGQPPFGEWLKLVIDWQDTITATLYESSDNQLQQVQMTDNTYSDGGIMFTAGASGSGTAYFDECKII